MQFNPLRYFKDLPVYPRIYREWYFIKQISRYIFLKTSGGATAWRERIQLPPTALGLNISGMCNARCSYCAYPFHKSDGIMPMNIFKKAVDDFVDMGGTTIGFSPMTGEPFLDPFLPERIEWLIATDKINRLNFSSNGIVFSSKEVADMIIGSAKRIKIQIRISMPGFSRERFERVFKVSGYESTLKGIGYLLRENIRNGSPADIVLPIQPDCGGMRSDRDFIDTIKPFIDDSHIIEIPRVANNWCGQIRQSDLSGDMVLLRPLPFRKIPCYTMLEGTIDVLIDGDVRSCGCTYGKNGKHDALVIGNIMTDSLKNIWFGPKLGRLCEAFTKGSAPQVCNDCAMYRPYGG